MSSIVDILCITAHPDDVEISAAGTVAKHVQAGRRVGIVDLTSGELGTRGNAELRQREAEAARQVLGALFRYQLGLRDGFFRADEDYGRRVAAKLGIDIEMALGQAPGHAKAGTR